MRKKGKDGRSQGEEEGEDGKGNEERKRGETSGKKEDWVVKGDEKEGSWWKCVEEEKEEVKGIWKKVKDIMEKEKKKEEERAREREKGRAGEKGKKKKELDMEGDRGG
ncbi:hypothetical protein RF55_13389 [Lasius niger]|uniref:Uncharacterized protein n=1 Tax=Lasius niger TaxID=67767 RepID=A0A0J7KAM4_LASNI|nr:hypothetical protein RF55_13389 [Lasius niger]